MKTWQPVPGDIDTYIAAFPDEVQEILEGIRMTIRKAAPEAEETIRYQIPAFKLNGAPLVYFAAFKKHVGLYPAPINHAVFGKELAAYASGKGTAKFPLNRPIPYGLIGKIVRFRAQEHLQKTAPGR